MADLIGSMAEVVTAHIECEHGEVEPHPDLPGWTDMSPLDQDNANQPINEWCDGSTEIRLAKRTDYWGNKWQWVSEWEEEA